MLTKGSKQRSHDMKTRRYQFPYGEMQTHIIPEAVLDQLRSHLPAIPDDIRRMVVLLLESGIRVSELCCLSYDCLEIHADGHHFLHYLDQKMGRGRSIPLSPLAVEAIMEQQQALEGGEKRDSHYLFPNQKGQPSSPQSFIRKLNRQASEKHICDSTGTVWRFRMHQIRTTVLWRVLHAPLHHVTHPLHHVAIEGQPLDVLQDEATRLAFEKHRDLPSPGYCTLENSCPWHDPITHYYVKQMDPPLIDRWDDCIVKVRKRLSEVDDFQEEADELQEIKENNSDGEALLFALGHMHCIVCEQKKTVAGSLLCQVCINKQKTLDSESNREPQLVPLFDLGRLIATKGALETMERRGIDYHALLVRHVTGDWGDRVEEDKHENEYAVKHGQRIHSAYGTPNDPDQLWIITEPDRHATTILTPDEY
jgi:hypothetical protein